MFFFPKKCRDNWVLKVWGRREARLPAITGVMMWFSTPNFPSVWREFWSCSFGVPLFGVFKPQIWYIEKWQANLIKIKKNKNQQIDSIWQFKQKTKFNIYKIPKLIVWKISLLSKHDLFWVSVSGCWISRKRTNWVHFRQGTKNQVMQHVPCFGCQARMEVLEKMCQIKLRKGAEKMYVP